MLKDEIIISLTLKVVKPILHNYIFSVRDQNLKLLTKFFNLSLKPLNLGKKLYLYMEASHRRKGMIALQETIVILFIILILVIIFIENEKRR